MKKKRLLIIPSKGFSKRIKNKNTKIFFGKPIISYSLNVAYQSKLFKKIHVSTESFRVKKIIEKLGYNIDFMRPKKLSKKNTPIIDVLRFVVNFYEVKMKEYYDEIWLLSACAPLLKKSDLIKASRQIKKNKVLLTVARYGAPIEWAFKMNKNRFLKAYDEKKLSINSQLFPKQYHDAGAFAIFSRDNLLNKNFNYNNNSIGYELPRSRGIDIDDIDDWKLIELLYKVLKKNRYE